MKRILFLLTGIFLIASALSAQLISTEQAFPTMGQSITLYYNSSLETGSLKDYTGDLYAHTGVIIEGNSSWQHVIESWGNNSTQPKLTYLGDHLYKLAITPDIETYYGTEDGEKVIKLAFVFRNEAANQQSVDLFIDIYEAGLNVSFKLPDKEILVAKQSDTVEIIGSASQSDEISLYINEELILTSPDPDSLFYSFHPAEQGEYWIKLMATKDSEAVADSIFLFVRDEPVVESLPENLVDGINYINDTTVILVLYAPSKDNVFVGGEFTKWLPAGNGYMKVTPGGDRFWIELTGLTAGKEYGYQYLVDNELFIADPYTHKILDPWNDHYIDEETYPGLIPYPDNNASGIVSVFQTAKEEYSWKNADFTAPDQSQLNIYELHIRDFIANHDYATLKDTLGYFSRLGINAIELMPVNEFEGNLSWGYNPSFYFAVDKYYGSADDLKAFIDSCHARGIAVIIDMVLNHSFGQHPLVQLYFDPDAGTWGQPTTENPWYNEVSPNQVFNWGYDFNHESQDTKDFVDRVNRYWMEEYDVDGFRFDFTKGFTNTPGDGGAYDADRINILKRMADEIWKVNPQAYVILEHFAPNEEEKILAEYGMLVWGNMNHSFSNAAKGYSSDLSGMSSLERGWDEQNLVAYMESHDEERIMVEMLTGGRSIEGYDVQQVETALSRMELLSVFLLSIPGPKMIWQFGEIGYDFSINYNGRMGEKPLKWGYHWINRRQQLFQVYSHMNTLRNQYPVFSTDDYQYDLAGRQKVINLNHPDMDVTILGNFNVIPGEADPNFQSTGIWYDYFGGDSIIVTDVNGLIEIQPGEYRIYTSEKLETTGIILGREKYTNIPAFFKSRIYPNPSSGNFNINISSRIDSKLSVRILDISGRVIRDITAEANIYGTLRLNWDGKTESGTEARPGMYLIHISSTGLQEYYKVIKE